MTEIKDLIKIVQDQFEDPTELELTADTNFKNLESFDSLTGMCIIVAIKDELGVEISEENFRKVTTIQTLFDLVIK